jgi:3-oxoacyl-(acyl-carrier-protein) synthase
VGEAAAAILLVDDDLPGVRLTGSGQSCDAFTLVRPTEDGTGLAAAIRQALEEAGPGAVDAICGHGTGTIANDGMELAAFRTAVHDAPPPVFGIKGATGHTLGAAGVLEAAACALSLIHGYLPGTVGFTGTASGVDVTTRTRGAAPRRILTVNSGFGGVKVALVLERTR